MTQGQAIDVIAEAFESSIVHAEKLTELYEYVTRAPRNDVLSALTVGINFARDERRLSVASVAPVNETTDGREQNRA